MVKNHSLIGVSNPWKKAINIYRNQDKEDMQQNTVKRSRKSKLADALEPKQVEPPLCPKPHRPSSLTSEFLYPFTCKHSHSSHHEVSSEILDMIGIKNDDEGKECASTGCPPSCYCGSPPSRVDNPHVHDVHFLQQNKILQTCPQSYLPKRLVFTTPDAPIWKG